MKHVGVYAGAFDPIHQGHISFALAAMRACGLDEVVFLPERVPRGKQDVTDIVHRAALIERATADAASLRVLVLAAEQFTVTSTLPELRALFGDAQLTFLVGSDVARTFPRWENLALLFEQTSFAIGMRADDSTDEITAIMEKLGQQYGTAPRYICLRTPDAGVASSHVRGGLSPGSWPLNPSMLHYVQTHGLYPQLIRQREPSADS